MLTKAKLKELKKAWNSNMPDAEIGPLLEHITEQDACISALESALAAAAKIIGCAPDKVVESIQMFCDDSINSIKEMYAMRNELAAARDDHRTWPTATSGCQAEPHMVSESELASLRSRADDEGRVERAKRCMQACLDDQEIDYTVTDAEARAVLEAADRREP